MSSNHGLLKILLDFHAFSFVFHFDQVLQCFLMVIVEGHVLRRRGGKRDLAIYRFRACSSCFSYIAYGPIDFARLEGVGDLQTCSTDRIQIVAAYCLHVELCLRGVHESSLM